MKKYKLDLVITDQGTYHKVPFFSVDLGIDFEPDNMALWNVITKELAKQEKKANDNKP